MSNVHTEVRTKFQIAYDRFERGRPAINTVGPGLKGATDLLSTDQINSRD